MMDSLQRRAGNQKVNLKKTLKRDNGGVCVNRYWHNRSKEMIRLPRTKDSLYIKIVTQQILHHLAVSYLVEYRLKKLCFSTHLFLLKCYSILHHILKTPLETRTEPEVDIRLQRIDQTVGELFN